MTLTRTLALLFLAWSGVAGAQDSAGLFFYETQPSLEAIARAAGEATVSSEQVESVTRVTVAWPDVSVIIHIDTQWPREEQLASIRGLLSELPAREQNKPAVKEFLANLERTTNCWGSLIEPGYDREGKVAAFFKRLTSASGGFLFTYQSFYSSDGRRIAGLEDDPDRLQ